MKKRPLSMGLAASGAMLILILDSQTALRGATEGIELCIATVIPSLFPFFVISILLTGSLSGVSLPVLRPLGKMCGVPEGAEVILISGFLGGYPAGAQSIAAAWKAGYLKKQDAQRMLSFCNNAGPAFLFGMAASVFSEAWVPWVLWGIHIGSAVLTSLLLPANQPAPVKIPVVNPAPLSGVLHSTVKIISSVCSWVILFRVLIAFLRRWILWIFPLDLQILWIGLLELSNGCCELIHVSDDNLRFLFCSGFLACGGLCVAMQTYSVADGLPLRSYWIGKAVQTVISLAVSTAIVKKSMSCAVLLLVLFVFLLRKRRKTYSIPTPVGV